MVDDWKLQTGSCGLACNMRTESAYSTLQSQRRGKTSEPSYYCRSPLCQFVEGLTNKSLSIAFSLPVNAAED